MGEWSWELAILLSKFVAYISFVSLTGGLFVLVLGSRLHSSDPTLKTAPLQWSQFTRRRIVHSLIVAAGLGKLAIALFFFLQVGQVNQSGIAGMFDGFMILLLIKTQIGVGAGLRLIGFTIIGLLLIFYRGRLTSAKPPVLPIGLIALWLLSILLCCTGFALLGHVASVSWLAQVVIGIHVLLVGLWIGSLYPLLLLCGTEPATAIAPLMKRFGAYGWGLTLGLSAAGIYLLTQLLASPSELLENTYGRLLTLKIVLVMCLLALAARNKFRLVPALQLAGAEPLKISIKLEMGLAIIILIATALLSTVAGPAH